LRAEAAVRALLVALVLLAGAAGAAEFVPGTEDVPLMPGLVAAADPVVFDKPEGRIVTTSARGEVSRAVVRGFYARTLPALGWQREGEGWRREGETLKLDFSGEDGNLTVGYTLTPTR
jgi:hypothetical protein